jgi:hypothetical protein
VGVLTGEWLRVAGEGGSDKEEVAWGRQGLRCEASELQGDVVDVRYTGERSTDNEELGRGCSLVAGGQWLRDPSGRPEDRSPSYKIGGKRTVRSRRWATREES